MNYIKFENFRKITLKKFLKEKSISIRAYQDLLKEGISVNDSSVHNNINLGKGDIVKIKIDPENLDYEPIKGELNIVYEDENIIVVNKPSGLTVNSKNQLSLANLLAYYFQKNDIKSKIRLINRLDMNTSGLMMVAKNRYAQAYYQKQIEENKTHKKYLAYVAGALNINELFKINLEYDEISKTYRNSEKGRLAITYFKTLSCDDDYSLIECDIKTGKTHQIRASLRSMGHPIIGDKLYGSAYNFDRFLLHSFYLSFKEFVGQESIILENLPEFKPFLLKLWKDYLAKNF